MRRRLKTDGNAIRMEHPALSHLPRPLTHTRPHPPPTAQTARRRPRGPGACTIAHLIPQLCLLVEIPGLLSHAARKLAQAAQVQGVTGGGALHDGDGWPAGASGERGLRGLDIQINGRVGRVLLAWTPWVHR